MAEERGEEWGMERRGWQGGVAELAATPSGLPWRQLTPFSFPLPFSSVPGFNPVYKNTEKTCEPWILHEFSEDFYGQQIRLLVCAYIRPEADFVSLQVRVFRGQALVLAMASQGGKEGGCWFMQEVLTSAPTILGCGRLDAGARRRPTPLSTPHARGVRPRPTPRRAAASRTPSRNPPPSPHSPRSAQALIDKIHEDADVTRAALDQEPYASMQADPCLQPDAAH